MPKIEKDLLKVKGSDGQWHYVPAVGGSVDTTPTWDSVQNKPFESLGDGLSVENGVLSAKGGTGGSPNAVQYVAQELTDAQKTQARKNIGAGTSSFSGSYNDLTSKPTIPTQVTIDSTLKQSGQAADAKAVGDALQNFTPTKILENEFREIELTFATKLDKNQGTTNAGKILGIGEDGIVVPQDKPTYTLPQATADALGGIKADAATAEDTQAVRIGADGKLKTKPTGGSTITVDSELSSTSVNPVQNKVVTAALAEKITAPTTAAVGQIIKVKSVDTSGKPTEWEAADLSSTMPLIFREIVPAGLAEWVRTTDASGKTFNLKRWELWIRFPFEQGLTEKTATLYINDGTTYSGTTMYYNDTSVPCYYYQLGDYIAQNYQEMKMRENYTYQAKLARINSSTAFNKCAKIRINTFSDTVKIPGNTEVTLFGIE